MSKDFKPCFVELEFGDGEHVFKLGTEQIAELQKKCEAGIGTIYKRVCITGDYYAVDLVETVRLGLIGGGMDRAEVAKLFKPFVADWPLEVWHDYAVAVIAACVHGYSEALKEPEKGPATTTGSTSPSPTGSEPSSDLPPNKSDE